MQEHQVKALNTHSRFRLIKLGEIALAKSNPACGSIFPKPQTPQPSEINMNRRCDYLPESMVPLWYIQSPIVQPEDSRHYLCATCRHIDFLALFKQRETSVLPTLRDYVVLGPLRTLISRGCGFCKLVARIIALDAVEDLPRTLSDEERLEAQRERFLELLNDMYYLCPVRFETTFNNPALYICSAKDINDLEQQRSSVLRPRQSMAFRPLHRSEPNLGRILRSPEQIDFEWIRATMQLCDERDRGKTSYQHNITVRAIDVDQMCIVDLDDGVRYVTLSYTWGKTNQLLLQRPLEPQFRTPGGLRALLTRIPRTIRDSIKLVRSIGERYLWVDALCILQDDATDKGAQIAEMGNIYRHSILTICACCGTDASYGLPGIDPGTRTTRQAAEIVGDLVLGNILPDSESTDTSKWSTRGWTLQEKVLSQRKLLVTDSCVRWWCWHTITSEDENCRHVGWKPGTPHRGMYFFKTEHELLVSKIARNSNMDIYAFIVADYTARDLTMQTDAEKAITGVFNEIDGLFRGSFLWGIPDTELCAGLLWVPLGSSKRRVDLETRRPLFPSWSWLGWVGQAAYPWLIERSFPMSEWGSPLLFKDMAVDVSSDEDDDLWFTGETYRMGGPQFANLHLCLSSRWRLDPEDGWSYIDEQSEAHRWLHPVLDPGLHGRSYALCAADSHLLHLHTLSAHFRLEGRLRKRKEKHDYLHDVLQVRLLDARGFAAGYVYVPDPATTLDPRFKERYLEGRKEFIVVSRASTNADPRVGRELLHSTPIWELGHVYSMAYMMRDEQQWRAHGDGDTEQEQEQHVNEKAGFDERLYDAVTPWGLFNVLMVEWVGGIAYRVAVGRVHVAAFMEAEPVEKEVVLG